MRFFLLPLSLILFCCLHGLQLKKTDVKSSMDEMLGYHVEYQQFSTMLAKRCLKIYLQQFDFDKTYMLQEEASVFLAPREEFLAQVVQNYSRGDLSDYSQFNQKIQKAILRARKYRAEAQQELIHGDVPTFVSVENYSEYADSEGELKRRIRNQMVQILILEKQGENRTWTQEERQKLFALWDRRFARLEESYLGDNEHYLCMHILKAMAKSLDAHTSYFSPEEAYDMRMSLEKQFKGIGVVLRESIDGVVIYDMIRGGPAERSGKISRGDLLVEVDGKSIEGMSYEEVLKQLQGTGTDRITIGLRSNRSFYRVQLTREKIVMQDDKVSYTSETFEDGIIGKINLPSFYEGGGSSCEADMRNALRELKKQGDIKGIVLDMRENSGGFLNQAVKVSSLFVSSGIIVISKYARGEVQYLRDLDGRAFYSGPLVILTSRASASAAEIVAQALQDYGTALIVGDDRTYGKGTIQYQTVTDLNATSFFKVTVGRYYTVSGRTTQIDGVRADILVPTAYSVLPIGERYLEYPLRSDRVPSAYIDPLLDIDPRNRAWFQKNYIPNLQKKLSVWTQMLDQLRENSSYRLQHNADYILFLENLNKPRKAKMADKKEKDLQMQEAVYIAKDMATLKAETAKKVSLLFIPE